MKKAFSILLITVLFVLGCSSTLAEDFTSLRTSITGQIGYSLSTWYSDSMHRALLTVSLILDYSMADNDISNIDLVSSSYVGKSDSTLMVVVPFTKGEKYICFVYEPSSNLCEYEVNSLSSSNAKILVEAICDSYYTNSATDLVTAANAVYEAVS